MLHLISGSGGLLLGASSLAFATLAAYAIRWGNSTHLLAGGFEVRGRWEPATETYYEDLSNRCVPTEASALELQSS